MRYGKAACLFAASFVLLACPNARAADGGHGGYVIHCDRPSKKGDRTRAEFSFATVRTTTTRWNGVDPQVRTDDRGCHLVATAEVLDADAKGRTTSGAIVIETFTKAGGGEAILAPGTRVIASLDGNRTRYTVDGQPVDESVRQYLGLLYYLSPRDDAFDMDRMWGTTVARHVGETWSLDPKLLALLMRDMGERVKDSDVRGRCTLVSVGAVDGEACFDLRSHVEANALTPPGYDHLPDGTGLKGASMEADRECFIPVDPTQEERGSVTSTTYRITTAGQRDGHRYTMEQVMEQRCHCRRLPLTTTGPTPTATAPATRPAP